MTRARDAVLVTVAAVLILGGAAACRAPGAPARRTTIAVEVGHGSGAERYSAESPDTVCSSGLAGAGSWAVQYTDAHAEAGLASLQVVAPAGAEGEGGTGAAYFGLAIGAGSNDSAYVVETRAGAVHPQGTGHVEVRGGRDTAVIVARGRSSSGAELLATIRCAQVRAAGPARR